MFQKQKRKIADNFSQVVGYDQMQSVTIFLMNTITLIAVTQHNWKLCCECIIKEVFIIFAVVLISQDKRLDEIMQCKADILQ